MTDRLELLTRAVELVYMRHGVVECDLCDTTTDAMSIFEIIEQGGNASNIDDVLFDGFERFKLAVGSTYEDSEFLFNLAKALA